MQAPPWASGFTIGVCASDSSRGLPSLLSFLLGEDFGEGFALQKLVVVASGCDAGALSSAQNVADSDARVLIISEPTILRVLSS